MPPTQTEELPLPPTPEGATELVGREETLLPLSPLDAMMHKLGVVLLYIFPASTSGYDLSKLQSSFITLVDEDYPILIGELYMDPQTGVVSVKQTVDARQKGAQGIRFETNPNSSLTTEDAMKTLLWELMPTPRAPTELICVKGTILSDGGLVIGEDASHTLLDGEGMFTFMSAWGQHYSGVSKQDLVDVQPAVDTTAEAPVPPPTAQHRFHFTPSMMKRIKEVASRGEAAIPKSDPSYVSTVDAVTGLFTALISQARGHGQDVQVTTAVNARARLNPPMPRNYAGNVIFSALSSYKAAELKASEDALVKLAQRVRGSIRQSDSEYLRDAIDFITEQTNLSAVQLATNFVFGPDIMYTSWVRTGMYDATFEGMRPTLVSVPPLPLDGFVIMSEPPRNSPGVDVVVFLERSAMDKLKELFAQVTYLHEDDTCTVFQIHTTIQGLDDVLSSGKCADYVATSSSLVNKKRELQNGLEDCSAESSASLSVEAYKADLYLEAASSPACGEYVAMDESTMTVFIYAPCSATQCVAVMETMVEQLPDCYTDGVNVKQDVLQSLTSCIGSSSAAGASQPNSGGECTDDEVSSLAYLTNSIVAT
ncbi:hypothetical protein JG688_00009368 [Phytophthora aleatoria]|uniref:Uncharacterized protein n=1 Tax=Phytophthora aleatoria TaxID=2496075 RepID=A0A8J5J6R2_9STRA|nr:hypothetical protein JG688_00009368 [Phytophthora aleatoria]